jgi:hypothetical protein
MWSARFLAGECRRQIGIGNARGELGSWLLYREEAREALYGRPRAKESIWRCTTWTCGRDWSEGPCELKGLGSDPVPGRMLLEAFRRLNIGVPGPCWVGTAFQCWQRGRAVKRCYSSLMYRGLLTFF